ncbi:myocardin-related transcription factor A isoform X2 [Neocloeon triangulifer]|nr:myocardin-related transcription factor A isoform X2 [Neocloeon triangulifer]
MAESSPSGSGGSDGGLSAAPAGTPKSPPKAEVDDSPLQKCMDKNKESLKVKLMLRRPINQLVAQGIMPPLKTPPAFHEQRQKLERAKTGDLLKAKIQQRPDRQELVRQHILEDVGHVDPSLAERQRMLKKARLQDALNDQLSHRPGPLELIKKNILHTDETIERAVKEGQIPFRATCEGHLTKPQHPSRYITLEEDSSSEGGQSPPQSAPLSAPPSLLPASLGGQAQTLLLSAEMCFEPGKSVVVPVSVVQCAATTAAASPSVSTSLSSLSPVSSVASPKTPSPALVATPVIALPTPPPLPPPTTITVQHIAPLALPTAPTSISTALTAPTAAALMSTQRPISRAEKEQQKNRKKSKTKTQPKARTIKFHEYKGPPNAQKSNNSPPPVETSYELLLQQQQLFLQWQLEWQHKYPQIILPAAKKKPASSIEATFPNLIAVTTAASPLPQIQPQPTLNSPLQPSPSPTILPSPSTPSTPSLPPLTPDSGRAVSKLEEMKVNDLKAELKRRNLPVSGSKPQLIDRLRPFSDQVVLQLGGDKSTASSSASSVYGISNPKSVGTLALGEESLSDLSSMDAPCSPGADTAFLSLEACTSPDNSNSTRSPSSHPSSPLSLGPMSNAPASNLLSPSTNMDVDGDMDMGVMDTTEAPCSPAVSQVSNPMSPASPFGIITKHPSAVSEDIINQQQRKIEQLQRELQKSQQQNHKIKSKEHVQVQQVSSQADNSTKNQLQQHLQQKQQQKQLQQQLQKLQQLQSLRQQQHLQENISQAATLQQPLQQPPATAVSAAPAQGLNVKASLAAFLLQQAQLGQTQHPLLLSITTTGQPQVANNLNNNVNNNNNTVVVNNKDRSEQELLQKQNQQQHQLALNQINLLQKQRSNTLAQPPANPPHQQNQRTASLPNFRGSFEPQGSPPVIQIASPKPELNKSPPPLYEEAAKLLKVHIKQDANSTKQKHIKSQIVDDVLEILIKNGELPPSAAQVPVTPTTPGHSTQHELVFKAAAQQQETKQAPPPTPPPLPVTMPDQDPTFTLNLQSMISDMALPDPKAMEKSDNTFVMSQLDLILGQTGNNPQPMSMHCNNLFNQTQVSFQALPVMSTNPTVDLGLDLESMDFGQLDPIKLEGADLLDKCDPGVHGEEPMEGLVSGGGGGDMPMDLDMSDWLESMLPSTSQPPRPMQPSSDLDTYDPLLSNSQDVFDLFNLEDTDLKMSSADMSALNWDKVDYAA